jgi:glycosyltransferase involved in cell wall biosynthesis
MRYRQWTDVVYTRFLGEGAATTAVWKRMGVLGSPLVATPANAHGAGDTHHLRSLPCGGALVRLLDEQCNAINLIAEDMVDDLLAAGFDGHNFSRIPNGIPLRALPPERATNPLCFLAVGRLTPQKGYDVLLRSLARLGVGLRGTRIRIIGDGPERDRLHALAHELGVEDSVEWLGELPQDAVNRHLYTAHAFLLPSRYEGMSNAGLEAMERCLPLVMSRCGGLDRYIDPETGWVVPVEDETALADALANAVAAGPHRLAMMGAAARRCVERKFDMQIVGERYLNLFEHLCGRGFPSRTRDPV